jgi:sarcosine oxidase
MKRTRKGNSPGTARLSAAEPARAPLPEPAPDQLGVDAELNWRIVELLQEDGRMPFSTIAEKTGVSEGTIRNRVNQLRADNVMAVTASVSPEAFGYRWNSTCFLKVNAAANLDKLAQRLARVPEIYYIVQLTGPYSLGIAAYHRDREHFREFSRGISTATPRFSRSNPTSTSRSTRSRCTGGNRRDALARNSVSGKRPHRRRERGRLCRDRWPPDIAIIGAGYTGLATALHLAESGHRPVVLEAREPGWGASGRNTGWLEPNWWLKRPSEIDAMFGRERGAALTRWVASGPQLLQRWIERHRLDVPIDNRGLLMATDQPAKAAALAAEAVEWQRAGVANEYVDATALERYVPTRRYRGAMLLRDGLTLNPLALSRELARAAADNGAQIFANTRVDAIEHAADRWQLSTTAGRVTARRLVLATDAYTRTLWPELSRSFATWHLAIVASEPYADLAQLMPCGPAFGDLGLANIFTLRKAAGRLVTSTFAPLRRGLRASAVAAPFARKFARVFPHLPAPRWEFHTSVRLASAAT